MWERAVFHEASHGGEGFKDGPEEIDWEAEVDGLVVRSSEFLQSQVLVDCEAKVSMGAVLQIKPLDSELGVVGIVPA